MVKICRVIRQTESVGLVKKVRIITILLRKWCLRDLASHHGGHTLYIWYQEIAPLSPYALPFRQKNV